ncbi:hypothetical protein D3C76_1334300 [compost metagenome]
MRRKTSACWRQKSVRISMRRWLTVWVSGSSNGNWKISASATCIRTSTNRSPSCCTNAASIANSLLTISSPRCVMRWSMKASRRTSTAVQNTFTASGARCRRRRWRLTSCLTCARYAWWSNACRTAMPRWGLCIPTSAICRMSSTTMSPTRNPTVISRSTP